MVKFKVDGEGYLLNPQDWDEIFATEEARKDGITLNDDYWTVLYIVRDYHKEAGRHPLLKDVIKIFGKKSGPKKGNTKYFYELFPKGADQICRIAGLPKPESCL